MSRKVRGDVSALARTTIRQLDAREDIVRVYISKFGNHALGTPKPWSAEIVIRTPTHDGEVRLTAPTLETLLYMLGVSIGGGGS